MAADARVSAHPFRHFGRGIVRAARAEIGRAHRGVFQAREPALQAFEIGDARLKLRARIEFEQAPADGDGDGIDVERAGDGKERAALFVLFADADRLMRAAVKLVAQLVLDQRTLFLDDHDLVETLREFAQSLRLQRPGAGDLVDAQAQRVGAQLVDAKLVERLAHIEIGFAGGDDAEPRPRAARDRRCGSACWRVARRERRRACSFAAAFPDRAPDRAHGC